MVTKKDKAKLKESRKPAQAKKKEVTGRVEPDQRIKDLEEQISKTKYNKRTQGAIGLMKAQLAKLKEKKEARASKKTVHEGYSIRKTGDAAVIMVGFPSVGKSTLLNALTNAESEVAHYAFTTLTVVPGVLDYKGAKIQVLDVPGVVAGAASGKGRGKEVLSVMRNAEMTMVVVDANFPEHYEQLQKEMAEVGIRPNQQPPDVRITKKATGGIRVASTVKLTKIDVETVKIVMKEFRIVNADIVIRTDISVDQLIDVLEKNKVYMPTILVLTKIDTISSERLDELKKMLNPDICISVHKKYGLEDLKELIFNKLSFIRIYTKEIGKEADMKEPMIMLKGITVRGMCRKLHKDFETKFKFSRVWGKSAKFPGQKFMLDHELVDGDVLEIHLN